MNSPKISVIMPVYNSGRFLREAIDSVLNQTEPDFEFLIINDGSIDNSEDIVLSYQDLRIRYLKNERNMGLCATLNRGLSEARGSFIARMDGDDINFQERFRTQLALMEREGLDICGSNWFIVNEEGCIKRAVLTVLQKEFFPVFLYHGVPFAHGSVMIRKDFLESKALRYGNIFKVSEDYGLWTEMYLAGAKFGNCSEILFQYRENSASITQIHGKKISRDTEKIRKYLLGKNRNEITLTAINFIRKISILNETEQVILLFVLFRLRAWGKLFLVWKKVSRRVQFLFLAKIITR